jgi:hypothetical protein
MARALKSRRVDTVYPVPEPDLTPEEMIARARALRSRLRAEQDEAEERGGYSDGMHREFLNAGFYRILQPRMFGGYEFDITTFYKTMLEISIGHPGAGWCATLCASHPWVSDRIGKKTASVRSLAPKAIFRRRIARRRPARRPRSKADIASTGNGIIAPGSPMPHILSASRVTAPATIRTRR